ncbi:C-terminal autoproteolytic domain of nucleoporin nup98, partial [Dacryopinax primogenitus]
YWTKPSIDELTKLNFQDLTHVENFTVGRNGYGQVRFVNPVDLTAVGNLRDIPGKVVVFNNKECTVYPNEDEKPNEGEGLNVAAVISLHNCFPTNKGTSEPFTDMKARKMEMHIAKLRRMQDTTFVDFSDKGVWTFRVEH